MVLRLVILRTRFFRLNSMVEDIMRLHCSMYIFVYIYFRFLLLSVRCYVYVVLVSPYSVYSEYFAIKFCTLIVKEKLMNL